jgi:hypothetical protein
MSNPGFFVEVLIPFENGPVDVDKLERATPK